MQSTDGTDLPSRSESCRHDPAASHPRHGRYPLESHRYVAQRLVGAGLLPHARGAGGPGDAAYVTPGLIARHGASGRTRCSGNPGLPRLSARASPHGVRNGGALADRRSRGAGVGVCHLGGRRPGVVALWQRRMALERAGCRRAAAGADRLPGAGGCGGTPVPGIPIPAFDRRHRQVAGARGDGLLLRPGPFDWIGRCGRTRGTRHREHFRCEPVVWCSVSAHPLAGRSHRTAFRTELHAGPDSGVWCQRKHIHGRVGSHPRIGSDLVDRWFIRTRSIASGHHRGDGRPRCRPFLAQHGGQGMSLQESKVAIVTGASQGIGAAIARVLARDGFRVVAVARTAGALETVVKSLPTPSIAVPCDLRAPGAADEVVDVVLGRVGRIDLLVNNASATPRGDFLSFSDPDWHEGLALKFFATVALCRVAWPALLASHGAVVNIAGIGGRTGNAEFTIGGSVNAALLKLTKALADRGIRDGIRVNAVNPSSIATERTRKRIQTIADAQAITIEQAAENLARQLGVARLGTPEEIANVVAFLASDAASYMQGAIVDVDGGQTRTL